MKICRLADEEGIDSSILNPDTVVQTWLGLAELKK